MSLDEQVERFIKKSKGIKRHIMYLCPSCETNVQLNIKNVHVIRHLEDTELYCPFCDETQLIKIMQHTLED